MGGAHYSNTDSCANKLCFNLQDKLCLTLQGTQAVLIIPAFQHRNAAEGRISVRLESQAYTLDV